MKKLLLKTIVLSFTLFVSGAYAQSIKCGTMNIYENKAKNDPNAVLRMQQLETQTQQWISSNATNFSRQIITIPVVVHVLYHTSIENISTAQIQSQINVLNDDFRLFNSDSLPTNHPFWQYAADSQIEFCLASRDPNGNPTSGITRTYTDSATFVNFGNEKFSSTGGKDNWNPTKYLNIWVCNLSGSTLGYAAFPSDLSSNPNEDGVVIRYEAFGDNGTAGIGNFSVNDLGRTGTHEVGHWLNLRHIWGDATCGDDFVSDTEVAEDHNYGCPNFPHNAGGACSAGPDGEMYMNYMDYVDDNCMNMFTFGQSQRMQAAINGPRIGLLTSQGCSSPNSINDFSEDVSIELFPNPNNGIFTLNLKNNNPKTTSIYVINMLGERVKSIANNNGHTFEINLFELNNGIYYLQLISENKTITKKVFIAK